MTSQKIRQYLTLTCKTPIPKLLILIKLSMSADHRRTTGSCKCQKQAHNHDQQDRHHMAFVNQLASTFWQHNWPDLISSSSPSHMVALSWDSYPWWSASIFFGTYVCWKITWRETFTLAERQRRGSADDMIFSITGPDQHRPKDWQSALMSSFFRVSFMRFLATEWMKSSCAVYNFPS